MSPEEPPLWVQPGAVKSGRVLSALWFALFEAAPRMSLAPVRRDSARPDCALFLVLRLPRPAPPPPPVAQHLPPCHPPSYRIEGIASLVRIALIILRECKPGE